MIPTANGWDSVKFTEPSIRSLHAKLIAPPPEAEATLNSAHTDSGVGKVQIPVGTKPRSRVPDFRRYVIFCRTLFFGVTFDTDDESATRTNKYCLLVQELKCLRKYRAQAFKMQPKLF